MKKDYRERERAEGLTVFDTGEILEPQLHHDQSGLVDFDNDESATELTVCAYPSPVEPDTIVLEIDAPLTRNLRIIVNDGDVALIDQDGAATYGDRDTAGVTGDSHGTDTLPGMLRAWAKGRLDTMAAVDFLIASGQSLASPAVHVENNRAWIDWEELSDWLDGNAVLSGGEYATWKIVLSLLDGDMGDNLWRIDGDRRKALLAALTKYLGG